MDLYSLPEPWDVQIYYPGQAVWKKPANCRNVYIHLCGAGGNGGAGQSGTAGTKRGGGGGGGGGDRVLYYGPSFLFEDVMLVDVAQNSTTATTIRFQETSSTCPEFRAQSGVNGTAGSGGVGGTPGASSDPSVFLTSLPPGINCQNISGSEQVLGTGNVRGPGGYGGYGNGELNGSGEGNNGRITSGCGGGGITSTYSGTTYGGNVVLNSGYGNGLLTNGEGSNTYFTFYSIFNPEGADGFDGRTVWIPGKAFYVSCIGSGGNPSANGTGGRGGNGGIGCGGSGGGAGVTGGAGGVGGHGIAIILSW